MFNRYIVYRLQGKKRKMVLVSLQECGPDDAQSTQWVVTECTSMSEATDSITIEQFQQQIAPHDADLAKQVNEALGNSRPVDENVALAKKPAKVQDNQPIITISIYK